LHTSQPLPQGAYGCRPIRRSAIAAGTRLPHRILGRSPSWARRPPQAALNSSSAPRAPRCVLVAQRCRCFGHGTSASAGGGPLCLARATGATDVHRQRVISACRQMPPLCAFILTKSVDKARLALHGSGPTCRGHRLYSLVRTMVSRHDLGSRVRKAQPGPPCVLVGGGQGFLGAALWPRREKFARAARSAQARREGWR